MALAWTVISQSAEVRSIVEENLLAAEYYEPLHPDTPFRELLVGMGDRWSAKADSMRFTRDGLLPKRARKRQPRVDFTPQNLTREQWDAYLGDFGDSVDIHLPDTLVGVIDEFESKVRALGSQSGRSIDTVIRNLAYAAGMSGNSYALEAGTSSTSLRVACCYGFHEAAAAGASSLSAVSGSNTLAITIGASTSAVVIGCSPDNTEPEGIYGPGTLTLQAAKTWSLNDKVFAADGVRIIRSGGGATMHALTVADGLTVSMIEQAVADLEDNNVPKYDLGGEQCYVMFASPQSIASLRRDPEFQQQNRGKGTEAKIHEYMAVEKIAGCLIIKTSTAPGVNSVDGDGAFTLDDPFPGGHTITRNASDVRIERPIICGPELVVENPTTNTVISEAGLNGTMKAVSSIDMSGILINVNGIDLVLRAPIDRRMETVAASWKFRAGHGIPTDRLTGDSQRYKRAKVLEHAVQG